MTAFERKTDQVEEALDNRSSAYHLTDIGRIMIPIAEEIRELEAASWQIFDSRFVSHATGHALDLLGGLVNEGDRGDSEASQKLRIALRLRAILSKRGKRKDFVELLALLEGTSWAISEAPGWVIITQLDSTVLAWNPLADLLEIASADGVLVRLAHNADASAPFDWPSADGTITGDAWPSEDGAEVGTGAWQGVENREVT